MTFTKKSVLFASLSLALFSNACSAKPKSDKEKISYAIGQQIGESIKAQSIDVASRRIRAPFSSGYAQRK